MGRRTEIPIEIRASAKFLLGMSPAQFLRTYWQKRPLLIRGMFAHLAGLPSAEELAGLACEEAALSRIVIGNRRDDRYSVRNGPFTEKDFRRLPKSQWTLLVQDVDKWDGDVARLLDQFNFVPAWRIDDVMVSYATDGGGVGAHVDNYDVFLLQGAGRRRWRISTDPGAPRDFRIDSELKLLREFTPTDEWLLEPGDALYLPPGVPHDGVAAGECMTFSIGMRAPAQAEMLLDLAETIAEALPESSRYADLDLQLPADAHEIDAATMQRVAATLPLFANVDKAALLRWFGCFITRYRSAQTAAPAVKPVDPAQLRSKLAGSMLVRNPWSRIAWARSGRAAQVFVAGENFSCTLTFARWICAQRECAGRDALAHAAKADLTVLAKLFNEGHFQLSKRSR